MNDETVQQKARRIADEEIEKAGVHPHCAQAATIHMRILRALLRPQLPIITPALARAVLDKSDREAAHRASPLSFIAEDVIE